MKTIFSTIFILILACGAFGQDHERGWTEELKGLTKYFVDTGADTKNRQRILKQIARARISHLLLVSSPEEAEMLLVFNGSARNLLSKASPPRNILEIIPGVGTRITTISVGQGIVLIEGKDGNKTRQVLFYHNAQESEWLKDMPATKFAKRFVKEFKNANGLK